MSRHSEDFSAWREAPAGDVTIRYLAAGNGAPVVLLHGLAGSVDWWRYNLKPLAASFRIYVLDLARFGGAHPRPKFSLDAAPHRIAAWMVSMGLPHASFIGHSMGGFIAASLAIRYPDLVRRLVLVCAALFPPNGPKLSAWSLLRWFPQFPPNLVPLLLKDAWWTTPPELWEASKDLLHAGQRPKLSALQTPTLLIWGDQDGILPLETAHDLAEQINGSVLKVFAGVGHCPMWEAPERFNREVTHFLRS